MKRLLLAIGVLVAAGEPSAWTVSEISCDVFTNAGGIVTGTTTTINMALGQDVVGTSSTGAHDLRHNAWPCGSFTATAVPDPLPVPVRALRLHPNVPNPFNPVTELRYDVPAGTGQVSLRIYDVSGRRVRTLVDGRVAPGRRRIAWDGTSDAGQVVASGVYYAVLSAHGRQFTRKMVLLK